MCLTFEDFMLTMFWDMHTDTQMGKKHKSLAILMILRGDEAYCDISIHTILHIRCATTIAASQTLRKKRLNSSSKEMAFNCSNISATIW